MDIDDFLDKELTDIGSPQAESGIAHSVEVADENLFEAIKDLLEKGSLDDAEKAYIELWQLLSKQNLKWDKTLHQQLFMLSRQFNSSIIRATDEMKRKAGQANELIIRARSTIKEGKKEESMKLYNDVQAMINSIPNIFFEEKKSMQDHVLALYRELMLHSEGEILKKVQGILNDLTQEISKANMALQRQNTEAAVAGYRRCLTLYRGIPDGFLRQRNPLGVQILEIYKAISIQNEINDLQKQIGYSPIFAQPMIPQPMMPQTAPRQAIPRVGREMLKSFGQKKHDAAKAAEKTPVAEKATEPQLPPPEIPGPEPKAEKVPSPSKNEFPESPREQAPEIKIGPPEAPEPTLQPSGIEAPLEFEEPEIPKKVPIENKQSSLPPPPPPSDSEDEFEHRISNAKKNIDRGLFNEASKDVDNALKLNPRDAEAKALRAKIRAWQ